MSDKATRATRSARALVAFAGASLLVLSPLRVTWASETAGIFGPLLMWISVLALLWVVLRSPRG